jgi:hypothetical protein
VPLETKGPRRIWRRRGYRGRTHGRRRALSKLDQLLQFARRILRDVPLLEQALWGFAAPGDSKGGFENVGGDFGETHAGGTFFAPAAWDWGEDFGGVLDHAGLLIRCEQEDAVALMLESEGGEDFSGDAEVGVAEMRAFGGLGQRECDAAKGGWFHLS